MTDTLLWDIEETARQLGGISSRTVRRLLDRGELQSKRIGRRLLVRPESVRAYLDRDTSNAYKQSNGIPAWKQTPIEPMPTAFTSVMIPLSGGLATSTQAAKELAAALALPTAAKLKQPLSSGDKKHTKRNISQMNRRDTPSTS